MSFLSRILTFLPLLTGVGAACLSAQVSLPASPANSEATDRGSLRSVLRPLADVRVSSRAAGIIEKFHVAEGSRVKAGDPILSLDMDSERAELAQTEALVRGAKAELERAKAEYERARPLSAENIFSEKQLVDAKTTYDLAASRVAQAEAARDLAKTRLANRTLTSPINGIFLKTSKSVGEAVDRFETVARVVDASKLEMVVYADAKYFAKFRNMHSAQVMISLSPESTKLVDAAVAHIDPVIDSATGTFRIKLQLEVAEGVVPGYTSALIPPKE